LDFPKTNGEIDYREKEKAGRPRETYPGISLKILFLTYLSQGGQVDEKSGSGLSPEETTSLGLEERAPNGEKRNGLGSSSAGGYFGE